MFFFGRRRPIEPPEPRILRIALLPKSTVVRLSATVQGEIGATHN